MFKFKYKGKSIYFAAPNPITFTSVISACWEEVKNCKVYNQDEINIIGNFPSSTLYQMCIYKN